MIRFTDTTLTRGAKCLLDKASLTLPQKSICGVIGRNGTGKSSLFAYLQGKLEADNGLFKFPINKTWSAISQELPNSELNLIEYTCHGDEAWSTTMNKLATAELINDGIAIAKAYVKLEEIDGYTIEARASAILIGLGFNQQELKNSLNTFSGGWQMRAQLARVMISQSDLLLLDEPTNHLDLESVTFLANWLKKSPHSAMIISHEREFLDEISTHSLHLSQKKLQLYSGNYTSFSKQFNEKLSLEAKSKEKIMHKRAHMQSYVDRFRYTASKAKQAQSRLKALEKLQFSETLAREHGFAFSFLPTNSLPSPAIDIQADLGYPNKTVLHKVNWSIGVQERIGVLGVNGAGKSTFLTSIAKQIPLLSGKVTWQNKLKIGYYSQQQCDQLNLDSTAYTTFIDTFPEFSTQAVYQAIARFQFDYQKAQQKIGLFSGGERARLALALLVYQKPNLLILDEPTNHLDIQMREALIIALQSFSGSVLLVSHDRYLLDCITDSLLIIKHGDLTKFNGSIDDYTQSVLESRIEQNKQKKSPQPHKSQHEINKKIASIEKQINKLNSILANINMQLSDPLKYQNSKQDELQALQAKRTETSKQIDQLNITWIKLHDL